MEGNRTIDSAQQRKLKYHLKEVAKLLKDDTPEAQLQDFESIEIVLTLPIPKALGFSVRWVLMGIAFPERLVRVSHGCKSSVSHNLRRRYIPIRGVAALRALMNSD